MTGIVLTSAMRANLLSLQGTQSLLSQTQLRLSTGLKVNSALDSPTAFFAASALNNRASDLSGLLDSMGQGIQVLKAADQGISALTTLVNQAKSIAQSAKDGSTGGAKSTSNDIVAADLANLTASIATAADTFTLQAGTTSPTVTFTITAGETAAQLVQQINSQAGFSAKLIAGTSTTLASNRRIEIRTTNGADLITTDTNGDLAAMGIAVGTTAATTGAPADQATLESQYNEVMTQIDNLVADAGYRGTNLLNGGTLSVQFNEDNTSSMSINGVTFDAAGLGFNAGLGTAGTADFSTLASIQASLDEVTSALDSMRSQASTFGYNLSTIQVRQDFTTNLIAVLKDGANQLTVADKNEEGANLLALQTTQQLGITSLSLASQANQSVLRLFQ